MTRRYVVLSDCSNYGDGILQHEADRIAAAEAAAIRRCFPDVLVSIERSTGPAPANDEDVDRWHEQTWEQILMVDGAEANYVDSVVEKWNGVQPDSPRRARCEKCGLEYAVDAAGVPVTSKSYTCDDCGGAVEEVKP